jgi:hypothetical protein
MAVVEAGYIRTPPKEIFQAFLVCGSLYAYYDILDVKRTRNSPILVAIAQIGTPWNYLLHALFFLYIIYQPQGDFSGGFMLLNRQECPMPFA